MHSPSHKAGAYLRTHTGIRRGLIGLAVAGLLLSGVLIALPLVAASYVEAWLRDNGAADARIDDVDINPFAGVVTVRGLAAGDADGARLHIDEAQLDLRWWPLASRRAYVELLRLQGVQADVVAGDDGVWRVGALRLAPGPEAGGAEVAVQAAGPTWGFGSELVDLRDVRVTYQDGVFDTRIDVRELRVGSQFSWETGRTTDLVVDLAINGSPLVLRSDVTAWAAEPNLSGRLTLTDLNLEGFRRELEALAGLRDARGMVGMDLNVSGRYDDDGVLRLEVSGPFNLNDAGFMTDDVQVSHQAFRWDGTISLALPAQPQEPLVRVDGTMQLAGLAAAAAGYDARLGDLSWDGNLALSPATADDEPLSVSTTAGLMATDLTLRHAGVDGLLAGFDEARVDVLELSGPASVSLDSLRLQGVRLLAAPEAAADGASDLLTVGEMTARGVSMQASRVRVDALTVAEPVLTVVRDEAGGIERLTAALAAVGGARADAAAEAAVDVEPTPGLIFELGRLEVTGTRWLDFLDRSVAPPASFQLADLALTAEEFSTESGDPVRFDLATSRSSTRLASTGTLQVLNQPFAADLEVQVESLALPPFSPYVPGYDIFRGRLSSDSRVTLAGDALDVRNDLLIERLQISAKDDADAVLSQGMTMPVDVALNLLRDRQDRIRFELPVTGSLSNPSFGTGDIVRQAMQKAVQNAAMSYVKNALQPLGALLMVGNLAAKAARPRFVPVEFLAGESTLPAVGREYLDKLSTMLAERPGLSLTLCGVATAADREALVAEALALQEAEAVDGEEAENAAAEGAAPLPPPQISDARLLRLAALRTTSVIGYLTEQPGVSRDRLFACREAIDSDADAAPRAEVTL
ncbi:MAG: DUF748 domain-containing protein [bacterium]